ncbi:MAG: serpin family protein, partial [Ruminococcus sp.]|nr:serpin family protein [Ruminococcus sp.]
ELSQCGLEDLFTEEIKLTNITFSDDLFVNDILQFNPSVTVNAAGISGTENIGTKVPAGNKEITPAEKKLEFNRPFIFMFVDNESNIPVYMGVVDI